MFLFLVVFGLVGLYVFLFFALPSFFSQNVLSWKQLSSGSMLLVGILSLTITVLTACFPSEWWGNRFEHAVGGGVVCSLVFLLAIRDSKTMLSQYRYIVMSVLVVTFFGVCNELVELVGQAMYPSTLIFSATVYDTWLDLLSNMVGTASAAIFVFFLEETQT